ncbi:hypothetical protein BC835DRAFT_1501194 [Cytidiella melzeri]|nr:hypothetical protein BC835DRAFT_1501194 [Cytidiella melzeri]
MLDGNMGLDGMGGMGGMQGMNGMGGMGMGGMGGGTGGNMNMRGMSNPMGGMQGMTQAQMAQMQMLASQGGNLQQQQLTNFDRPTSSSGPLQQQLSGQGHHSPTQSQAAFAQQQAQSPVRSHTPHGPQGSGMMQQQMNTNMMMPPPSIPPRPPTTAPSPSPRPGTAGSGGGMGMLPQHQQQFMQSHAQSPRPGTGGAGGPGTPDPRASSSMGMQGGPQQLQAPLPIQPKPSTPLAGSPAPPQRPGTAQSQHSAQHRMGSRPGTASGFRPQGQSGQQQQQQPGGPQQQIQVPTSTAYPPIAPAPMSTNSPGSPMIGIKRKVSGTPVPGTPGLGPGQQMNLQHQQHLGGQQGDITGMLQQMPPNQNRMPGMSPTPIPPAVNPAQMANMNMRMHAMTGGPGGMNPANMMGMGSSGMMGPPVLPRSQSQGPADMNGMNGMQSVPGLARQSSVGDLRNIGGNQNVANLNINTSMNSAMGMGMGGVVGNVPLMNPVMGTPTMSGSPSIGLPMDAQLPSTPRQGSLPPSIHSPFGPGSNAMMGLPSDGMERKLSSTSVLSGAPPLTRSSTSDLLVSANSVVTASSAAASAPGVNTASNPAPSSVSHHLPPPPANVTLNPKVTRVQIVPLIDSEQTIPALTEEEIKDVQTWMKADSEYEAMFKKMRERVNDDVKDLIVKSRAWWEKDPMQDPMAGRRRGAKFEVIGLKGSREDRQRRLKVGRREGFRLPRIVKAEEAERPEQLVPIRLELDIDHNKMRDTFVWNLNDPIITPEIFAQSIVDDYSLAPSYLTIITKVIQDQLSDYKAHSTALIDEGGVPEVSEDVIVKGMLEGEEEEWWGSWRSTVRAPGFAKLANDRGASRGRKRRKMVKDEPADSQMQVTERPVVVKEQPMTLDDFEEDDSLSTEEMRILVKLDIIVGTFHLEDQIEWDIDSLDPAPEQFADVYAKDLGLGGEFKTAIAHSIREQVQLFQKSLFLVGHPSDGSAVQDDDLRMSLLPSLSTGARSMDQVIAFTPQFNYLSDSEIERNEKEREKELNRRKRKTPRGRRGIALPDREPPKTFRTPAIGFPEIDPATLALVQAANAPTSRRAAAAAASLTIANMVASENGTTILPQTVTTPVVQAAPLQQQKEKKMKGVIKAPPLPPTVYGPRATVKAPTPSTAAEPSSVPPPIENDLPLPSSAPENRGARVPLSAKRAKELEREAKEREYVDGQHPNSIDGVWHCSNCGCPDNIAIGRRKGPLGDKSQCGPCGKFWHRHRRPRPVEYNPTEEFHQNLKRQEEEAKLNASRKKRPHSHAVEAPSSKAPTVEPETPGRLKPDSTVSGPPPSIVVAPEDRNPPSAQTEQQASPMSTASSASEAPLAQVVKTNGSVAQPTINISIEASARPAESVSEPPADTVSVATPGTPSATSSAPPTARGRITPPEWLGAAIVEMQERYPDDRFEALLPRKSLNSVSREWRIKCLDCPGKLYTPGPGETLQNYEVHLKNRQHRQKVTARVTGVQS